MKTLIILVLVSCAALGVEPDFTWKRLFVENIDLVGVKIQQNPDNGNIESYVGKHPCMAIYVFKDRDSYRVFQAGFTPSGMLSDAFWWDKSSISMIDEKFLSTLMRAK